MPCCQRTRRCRATAGTARTRPWGQPWRAVPRGELAAERCTCTAWPHSGQRCSSPLTCVPHSVQKYTLSGMVLAPGEMGERQRSSHYEDLLPTVGRPQDQRPWAAGRDHVQDRVVSARWLLSQPDRRLFATPTGAPCPRTVRQDGSVQGSGACLGCGTCLLFGGLVDGPTSGVTQEYSVLM